LRGGIIAVVVIITITLIVLLYARVGALHGKKVTLYVVTSGAAGILPGTEIWLAGEKEGTVKDISFRPPTVPESERLLITTEFLESGLPNVRRDSYAQIRPSGSLVGTPIIFISTGTATSPPLKDGDTVWTRPKAVSRLSDDVSKLGPEFAALGTATKELANKINRPVGTFGNYRASGLPDLPDVQAGMSSLNTRARSGGSIGLATRGNLRARASHAMAAADSIRSLLASSKGNIGRFRRDRTLVTQARHVLAEVDTLRTLFTNPVAAIGGADPDSSLSRQLQQTRLQLASLISDVRENPKRYIHF
jgi:ABC-type transporter Mla subunit MlaD